MLGIAKLQERTKPVDQVPKVKLEHVLTDLQISVPSLIQHRPFHVATPERPFLHVHQKNNLENGQIQGIAKLLVKTKHVDQVPKVRLEHVLTELQINVPPLISHRQSRVATPGRPFLRAQQKNNLVNGRMPEIAKLQEKTKLADQVPKVKLEHVLTELRINVQLLIPHRPFHVVTLEQLCLHAR